MIGHEIDYPDLMHGYGKPEPHEDADGFLIGWNGSKDAADWTRSMKVSAYPEDRAIDAAEAVLDWARTDDGRAVLKRAMGDA